MFTGNEEINSTHKRKVDNDSFDELQTSSKKPLLEANVLPESPEQLESLLIPIDYARQLLASSKAKWPLKKLRTILEGSWMRYQAVRDRSKNPLTSFFIDCVIHVNRDGLRFKNTRENSYRSIIKLKECETSLDNDVFKLWLEDLRRWNVPVPSVDELKAKRKIIEQAIEEIKSDKQFNSIETSETRNITNEDETRVQIKSENILPKSMSDQNEMEKQPNDDEQLGNTDNSLMQSTSNDNVIPGGLTRENISKMVITIDELCRLLDYGKEVFERVVTGFFVEIRAPPNPNHKKVNPEIKGHLIYLDQVIGVNWVGKPYLVFQKPMTLSLKFRHFRDEKLKLLPCRNRNTPIDQKAINQWIYDTIEWEEDFPTKEFIEQKAEELKNVFSEAPKGPPIDLMQMVEGENSTKQLRRILAWQREQQELVDRLRHPFVPPVAPYSSPYNRFQSPYPMQGPPRYPPHLNQGYPSRPPYPVPPPLVHNYSHPYMQGHIPPMNRSYFPNSNAYQSFPPRPLRTISYGPQRPQYW